MTFWLYFAIADSLVIAIAGLAYLFVDTIRFDAREAGRPWHEHPMVLAPAIIAIGTSGFSAMLLLAGTLLAWLGVPHPKDLGLHIGVFAAVFALLLWAGPSEGFAQTLPAQQRSKLAWIVAAESFCKRNFGAWWLPRAPVALIVSLSSIGGGYVSAMLFVRLACWRTKQRFKLVTASQRER